MADKRYKKVWNGFLRPVESIFEKQQADILTYLHKVNGQTRVTCTQKTSMVRGCMLFSGVVPAQQEAESRNILQWQSKPNTVHIEGGSDDETMLR